MSTMNLQNSDVPRDLLHHKVAGVLASFMHPTLKHNLITLKALTHCVIENGILHIGITMPFVWQTGFATLKQEKTEELQSLLQVKSIEWQLHHYIATMKRANGQDPVQGVKNIIAVSSAKGGVGKSSIAVNFALALAKAGAKVGILDADIYGPSVPTMLGTAEQRPSTSDGQSMDPIYAYDIQSNSIGYLVDDSQAMVWRGPMASKALMQLLRETLWRDVDYLILDMPPGTGDIQLTLAQSMPVTAAIVVSTPQDIALIDAIKGIKMFEKVSIPILGVVENMSYHICQNCGHQEAIFGEEGVVRVAEKFQIDLLSQIPLHRTLREDLDAGTPTVVKTPNGEFSAIFNQLAEEISTKLYWSGTVIPTEIPVKTVV